MQVIKSMRRPVQHTVFGYFISDQDAETAVAELRESGFHRDQISVGGQPLIRIPVADPIEPEAKKEDRKIGEARFWDQVRSRFNTIARRRQTISTGAGPSGAGTGPAAVLAAVEEIGGTSASVRVHLPAGSPVSPVIEVLAQPLGYARTEKGVLLSVQAGGRREDAEAILEAHEADMQDYLFGRDAAAAIAGKSPRLLQRYADALHLHRGRAQRGDTNDKAELPKAS